MKKNVSLQNVYFDQEEYVNVNNKWAEAKQKRFDMHLI